MCIIIYKPKGIAMPDADTLSTCWDSNSHGAGFMYSDAATFGKKLIIEKGFLVKQQLLNRLEQFSGFKDAMVIHFRLASHGAANKVNTHPWKISNKLAMVHNGIIQWCGMDRTISDSKVFSELLADTKLDPYKPAHMQFIEQAVGSYNKIVFMNNLGEVTIANRQCGIWDKGLWYSNGGYKTYRYDVCEELVTRRRSRPRQVSIWESQGYWV